MTATTTTAKTAARRNAEAMLAWIEDRCADGFTCYLTTALSTVPITTKTLEAGLVRVTDRGIETRHGRRWDLHLNSQLTASKN